MGSVNAHIQLNEPELNNQVRAFEQRRMASLQRRIANQARLTVPVDTGRLRQTIGEGPRAFVGPRTVTGSVHAKTHYAAAVHEGRRAITIRPRNAKALRFVVGGRVVFAKVVHQGPMRGRPFLRNAGMRVAERER